VEEVELANLRYSALEASADHATYWKDTEPFTTARRDKILAKADLVQQEAAALTAQAKEIKHSANTLPGEATP
jgi:hypothetical protein